jgi:putative ABC transport system permease protein
VNRLLAYLGEALESMTRNRVRSGLTMLGMIIGSASIIAVFGISKAATSGIAATFASFGVYPVLIKVDPSQDYPDRAQIQYRDVRSVAAALGNSAASVQPTWDRIFPIVGSNTRDYVSTSADGAYHTDALTMASGRKIDATDVESAARVVVISLDLAEKFFGTPEAAGRTIRINGGLYDVIGVYSDIKGSFFNTLAGSFAAVPYTTFQTYLADGSPPDSLLVYPSDPLNADAAGKAAVAALRHIHGSRAEYVVQNTADELRTFENVLSIVGTALAAIGAVALVVAGIGIMNIMLVSVTERTREIGIRKSIGASRNDIALQFLAESILLSILGGGIGTALGLLVTVGAADLLSKELGEMLIPYLLIVSIAILFSFIVGTVFGTYPALRAARMDPIEALRS